MSQQLTISSLFSAFALVTLVLFARAGDMAGHVAIGEQSAIVMVEASAEVER
ncbi:hypothetical protein [uncultured Erythrobacter sp.]|uniref:hypothetical protein n=1 Tax=uncultured Erythrobacter sp. TaxID=263913 RepID=UPI00260911C6|nr:hypothetical protein [uncultured Erythrobacter sp.]